MFSVKKLNFVAKRYYMVPKIIHLCWFSHDPYPIEIQACLNSWKKHLPDYKIHLWDYDEAQAIGCPFINEALSRHRWAFAADALRFYAVYKEGGVYMDSDIFLRRRFDEVIPEEGCVTFNEYFPDHDGHAALQAAFFMGSKGNEFCKKMYDYYNGSEYKETISPYVMANIAEKYFGYKNEDTEQHLNGLTVYPSYLLTPSKRFKVDKRSIGIHCIYGSWRNRKFGRKIEIGIKHAIFWIKFRILHLYD